MQKYKLKNNSGGDHAEPVKKKQKFTKSLNNDKEVLGKPGKLQTLVKKTHQSKDNSSISLKKKDINRSKDKIKTGFNIKNTTNQSSTEKPKWSEVKKEKKQLRIKRKMAKITEDVFEKSSKAKMLAAQIQRKVTKPEFRLVACKELHNLLKKQYKSLVLSHDLSRVIQVLLKYSPEDIKTEITEELLDIIVQMAQSKYAHHTVRRILKYGSDYIRHEVIKRFYGHIVSLATHTVSAPLLDYAYGEFATKKEKQLMQQEFYGDIYKNTKDDKLKTLSDAYVYSPQLKSAILNSCKASIQKIMDKNLHDGELFHSVLYDYLRECGAEERAEMVTSLSALVVPLASSLPGANAACLCVWHGTNKDKKTILKVVKEHAVSLSKHKFGYRLVLAILDAVDDTVLVRKTIIAAIIASLTDVVADHWGNMVVRWLVKPKDTAAFHPMLIKFLEDGAKLGTSKKDPKIREEELRDAIMPVLIQDIVQKPEFWLSSKHAMLLVVTILSIESSQEVFSALARVICDPKWQMKTGETVVPAVEDAGVHMCLKKMAARAADNSFFADAICEKMEPDTIKLWLSSNRGCFFLLKLIQNNNDVASRIIDKIKPYKAMLKKSSFEGAKLLENIVKP